MTAGRLAAGLCLSVLAPLAAGAAELTLSGEFVQGGMVVGRAEPGSSAEIDGRRLAVAPDGRFVFGFGHDAAPAAELVVHETGGGVTRRRLSVRQRTYRVQRIDGLPRNMVTPSARQLVRIQAEGRRIAAARDTVSMLPHFAGTFIWPVRGRISGVYGSRRILNGEPRRPHLGIDIAAPKGTPVTAAAAGVVTLAERDLYFTGGTVIIDHGLGISTVYSHLETLHVGAGDAVAQGEVIAEVGSTGRSTGPHLDWRVNWLQERLDPELVAK